MLRLAAAGPALLAAAPVARAQAAAMVSEQDSTAAALGYVADATRVNRRRFPRYETGQACRACQLYTGRPGAPSGGCGIFPGREVAAVGWCSAFAPKG